MNRHAAVALALLALAACQRRERPAAASADTAMTIADSFRTPESVLYDERGDAYLVSNINGSPAAQDDNGFISRVTPDGHVAALRWIDGAAASVTLNAPKGMGISGDTLFVADIDAVRMFDRNSGAPLGSRSVPGATFLNDVAVGPDGTVYVTDSGLKPDFSSSGSDALDRFDDPGRAVALARGASLGRPNGIVADSAGVVVVTFGSGEVYRLDASGRRTDLPKPPHGQLDGVVLLGDGALLVSSWEDSSVVRMSPGAVMYNVVVHGVPSPADIGFDSRRRRLLIPVFTHNRIEVRPLAMGMAGTAHAP
jgi:sugar lactone lactonase YvrE